MTWVKRIIVNKQIVAYMRVIKTWGPFATITRCQLLAGFNVCILCFKVLNDAKV